MFRRLVLAFLLVTTFVFTSPVSALDAGDVVISLAPSEQDIDLTAGTTYIGSVNVSNIGRLPFDATVQTTPYYVKDESYNPDFSSQSSFAQLARWITLPQTQFTIEPGQTISVPFEIAVPEDAVGGGQYAALLIQADGSRYDQDNDSPMKLTGQLAAILRGHIDGAEAELSGELTDHSLPQFMFNQNLAISETVKNTGNTDFKVTQTLTVRNFFTGHEIINPNSVDSDGRPIGTSIATILPDTSRTSILTWSGAPKLGVFRVEQTIKFLDQSYFYQQIVILCPIWLIFILAVVIFAFIFSIFAHFKRKIASKTV